MVLINCALLIVNNVKFNLQVHAWFDMSSIVRHFHTSRNVTSSLANVIPVTRVGKSLWHFFTSKTEFRYDCV